MNTIHTKKYFIISYKLRRNNCIYICVQKDDNIDDVLERCCCVCSPRCQSNAEGASGRGREVTGTRTYAGHTPCRQRHLLAILKSKAAPVPATRKSSSLRIQSASVHNQTVLMSNGFLGFFLFFNFMKRRHI